MERPVLKLHRAAGQRELASIVDDMDAEHQRALALAAERDDVHLRLDRIERALLLLRDELFNNPNRPR